MFSMNRVKEILSSYENDMIFYLIFYLGDFRLT